MYLSVIDVKPQTGYKLLLTFENGEKRIFEMSEYLDLGVFKKLRNYHIFNTVHIVLDSVEWANGIDLDPEELYCRSKAIA
jgi:hypothetical protein